MHLPRPSAEGNRVARTVALGAGERETLDLYFREGAAVVLSDDRAFLTALQPHATPFLTPAAALIVLVERKALTLQEANAALESLRPLIREEQFRVARADLQRRARSGS